MHDMYNDRILLLDPIAQMLRLEILIKAKMSVSS